MKKLLSAVFWMALAVLFSTSMLFAQLPDTTWTQVYGGPYDDVAYWVEQMSDSGYIIVGRTGSFGVGNDDFYLIRTHSDGSIMWTRTYGTTANDQAYCAQQTQDGGYILCGVTDYPPGDGWLVKTNSSGDTAWTEIYDDGSTERIETVRQTQDGGYILAGYTWGSGAGGQDMWLIKVTSTGAVEWEKTFGGTSDEVANCVWETSDTGYILVGRTESYGAGQRDVYLVKTDDNGDTLWTRTYGGTDNDVGYSVIETNHGNEYVIAGGTWSFGSGDNDVFFFKVDSLGIPVWTRWFGGSNTDIGYSVAERSDGCFIIAGATNTYGAGGYDVYLIKADSLGGFIDDAVYGGGAQERAYCVQVTNDQGYIVAGFTYSFAVGGFDFYLLKIGPDLGVVEDNNEVLRFPKLHCSPNPIRKNTVVKFSVPDKAYVNIGVYNLLGQEIGQIVSQNMSQGEYSIQWNVESISGRDVPGGVYFIRAKIGEFDVVEKLLIVK